MFGLFVCGTPLGSGCWWSPGERFATGSVAARSVGALWPAFGWRVRTRHAREVPLRPLDLSRVDLLVSGTGVTPDGRACSPLRRMASGRARPSLGAPMARQADSGPHKTDMPRLCLAATQRRHPLGRAPTTERLLARGFGIIGADPEVTTRSRACQMGSTAFCDCMTMACQG